MFKASNFRVQRWRNQRLKATTGSGDDGGFRTLGVLEGVRAFRTSIPGRIQKLDSKKSDPTAYLDLRNPGTLQIVGNGKNWPR